MAWYPDWVVALDDTAKGKPNANVTPDNARDAIREIKKLQARIKELETGNAEHASRAADDMARRIFESGR
jgi:hypothetical protein